MWALMCCGCRGVMQNDGSVRVADAINLMEARSFPSKKDADAFAVEHGWSVEDKEGPNHRCPGCIRADAFAAGVEAGERRASGARGAYIKVGS